MSDDSEVIARTTRGVRAGPDPYAKGEPVAGARLVKLSTRADPGTVPATWYEETYEDVVIQDPPQWLMTGKVAAIGDWQTIVRNDEGEK